MTAKLSLSLLQLGQIKKSIENEYEIVSELGSGAFGIAYRGRKIKTGIKSGEVVLKVLVVEKKMCYLY